MAGGSGWLEHAIPNTPAAILPAAARTSIPLLLSRKDRRFAWMPRRRLR
jgi:hypothetical protein